MARWRASVLAILLASFPGVSSAQVDCDAVPHGPARTDCYVGLSRVYRGQSDVAAGNARVQSDAARLQRVTGTRSHSKASKHRRKKLPQLAQNEVADRSGQGSSAAPSGRGKIGPGIRILLTVGPSNLLRGNLCSMLAWRSWGRLCAERCIALALQARPKCNEVARVVRTVDHTMTVRAKNRKILGDVVLDRDTLC